MRKSYFINALLIIGVMCVTSCVKNQEPPTPADEAFTVREARDYFECFGQSFEIFPFTSKNTLTKGVSANSNLQWNKAREFNFKGKKTVEVPLDILTSYVKTDSMEVASSKKITPNSKSLLLIQKTENGDITNRTLLITADADYLESGGNVLENLSLTNLADFSGTIKYYNSEGNLIYGIVYKDGKTIAGIYPSEQSVKRKIRTKAGNSPGLTLNCIWINGILYSCYGYYNPDGSMHELGCDPVRFISELICDMENPEEPDEPTDPKDPPVPPPGGNPTGKCPECQRNPCGCPKPTSDSRTIQTKYPNIQFDNIVSQNKVAPTILAIMDDPIGKIVLDAANAAGAKFTYNSDPNTSSSFDPNTLTVTMGERTYLTQMHQFALFEETIHIYQFRTGTSIHGNDRGNAEFEAKMLTLQYCDRNGLDPLNWMNNAYFNQIRDFMNNPNQATYVAGIEALRDAGYASFEFSEYDGFRTDNYNYLRR